MPVILFGKLTINKSILKCEKCGHSQKFEGLTKVVKGLEKVRACKTCGQALISYIDDKES